MYTHMVGWEDVHKLASSANVPHQILYNIVINALYHQVVCHRVDERSSKGVLRPCEIMCYVVDRVAY